MNDFETVRKQLHALATYGHGTKPGHAALDRIEAEIERLRTENLQLRARIEEAWDEHPGGKE